MNHGTSETLVQYQPTATGGSIRRVMYTQRQTVTTWVCGARVTREQRQQWIMKFILDSNDHVLLAEEDR